MTEPTPHSTFPRAALDELRRPFPSESVRFKVQATWPKDNPHTGLIVTYMDARLVTARLNHVCAGNWSNTVAPWGEGAVKCALTVYGVTREDVGKGTGIEKEKASVSDAFKRAAVQFGVGAYLYSLKATTLKAGEGDYQLDRKTSGNKKTLVLPDSAIRGLRDRYAQAMASEQVVKRWGEILSHADELGAVGDPVEAVAPQADEPALELAAAKQEADTFYQQQPAKLRRKFTPGRFRSNLEECESVEDVAELVKKVEAADESTG